MKQLICYIKAIPFYLRTGEFIPHIFKDSKTYTSDIFVTENDFRLAETYTHLPQEKLIKNATIYESECKYCGKKIMAWSKGEIPVW